LGALSTMLGRWCLILSPLLIREFLIWINKDESYRGGDLMFSWSSGELWYGGVLIGLLTLIMICASVFVNHAYYQGVRVGCAYRTALMSLIYEKSLRCSNASRMVAAAPQQPKGAGRRGSVVGNGKKPEPAPPAPPGGGGGGGGTGQTVNLMANDTQQIFDAS